MWGDWGSVASHHLSLRRSLPRPISASFNVVYSAGAGVVPRGELRHRRVRLSKMAMHVDAIRVFAWMRWYAASISGFPIRTCFDDRLIHMVSIMWSILMRQNP